MPFTTSFELRSTQRLCQSASKRLGIIPDFSSPSPPRQFFQQSWLPPPSAPPLSGISAAGDTGGPFLGLKPLGTFPSFFSQVFICMFLLYFNVTLAEAFCDTPEESSSRPTSLWLLYPVLDFFFPST